MRVHVYFDIDTDRWAHVAGGTEGQKASQVRKAIQADIRRVVGEKYDELGLLTADETVAP